MGRKIKVAVMGEQKITAGDLRKALGNADVEIVDCLSEAEIVMSEYKSNPVIEDPPELHRAIHGPSKSERRKSARMQRRFNRG